MKQSLLFCSAMTAIKAANAGLNRITDCPRQAEELVINTVLTIVYGGLTLATGEWD